MRDCWYVIEGVRVAGRDCSGVDDFSRLADALCVRIESEKAWGFWAGWCDQTQGPYVLQLAALRSLHAELEKALSLENLAERCRPAMQRCPGLVEPIWSAEKQVASLIASCRLALARKRKRAVSEEIQEIQAPVSAIAVDGNAHPSQRVVKRHRAKRRCIRKRKQQASGTGKERQRLGWLTSNEPGSTVLHASPTNWSATRSSVGQAAPSHRGRVAVGAGADVGLRSHIQEGDAHALESRAKQIGRLTSMKQS